MARVKGGMSARRKHNKVLKLQKDTEAQEANSTELQNSPL